MSEFIAENFGTVITFLVALLGGFNTLVWKHLDSKFKELKDAQNDTLNKVLLQRAELEAVKSKSHTMETNYISRFGKIEVMTLNVKESIMAELARVKDELKRDIYEYRSK